MFSAFPGASPGAGPSSGASGAVAVGTATSNPAAWPDLVKRSTRFETTLPAPAVLRAVREVVAGGAVPLPPPFSGLRAECSLAWEDYRLDVRWGAELAYSVHVFQLTDPGTAAPASASSGGGGGSSAAGGARFMVEFRRGNVDSFAFRRHYDLLLERLDPVLHGEGTAEGALGPAPGPESGGAGGQVEGPGGGGDAWLSELLE
jgi:hypothetical protein